MADINDENSKLYSAHERTDPADNGKKKKMIIGGVIGAVVLVAIILIIVFTTGGKPGPGPGPSPGPDGPAGFQELNPMEADASSVSMSNFEYKVVLDNSKANPTPSLQIQDQQIKLAAEDKQVYKPVDSSAIPVDQANNEWIEKVQVNLDLVGENQAHLRLFQVNKEIDEYVTPDSLFSRPSMDRQADIEQTFSVTLSPFSFQIMDRANGNQIIQTNNRKLVIQDKFKEMGFEVKSQDVYGLGLSNRQFTLNTGAYTLYSTTREEGSVIDTSLGGQQGPAMHPFLMFKTDDNQFAAVYFPNSSPAQFEIIRYEGYDWTIINYITVSGSIEAYFILPDSAENVISQYIKMVNLPAFPPLHALGFYQGSDSYDSLKSLQDVADAYEKANFLVEGYNLDNYNQNKEIFTLNSTFAGIEDWKKEINAKGQSLILSLIHAIAKDSDAFSGLSGSLLMADKTNVLMNELKGIMVAYPDWFDEDTREYYAKTLATFEKTLSFDGLNLPDNTNYGDCDGVCEEAKKQHVEAIMEMINVVKEKRFLLESEADPANEEDVGNYKSYKILPDQKTQSIVDMPFQMGIANGGGYQNNTASIAATHPGVSDHNLELTNHNLNGYQSVIALYEELTSGSQLKSHNGKRPFIMSDNTFPGAGKYTGSWLSNFRRTWTDMRNSIAQVMNLNMFGVLLAGTEVCGSLGAFDPELCARWTQNAVLVPAVRNYYNSTFYNETSMAWEQNPRGELYMINTDDDFEWHFTANGAIKQRYSLMSYMYSQLYVSSQLGKPYMHPVFFEEPQSSATFADPIEGSYLAGEALHVATILEAGLTKVTSVFPMGKWIRLSGNMNEVLDVTEGNNAQTVDIRAGEAIVHMREGTTITYQPDMENVKATRDLLATPTDILVFRDAAGYAFGRMMIDDGVSIHTTTNHGFYKVRLASNTLQFELDTGSRSYAPDTTTMKAQLIRNVKILNAADLASVDFACIIDSDSAVKQLLPVYNEGTATLLLRTYDEEYFTPQAASMIRFGDSTKETNICNVTTSFKYKVQDSFKIADVKGVSMTVPLENLEMSTNTLSVTFTLLDDAGAVKAVFSRDGKAPADQTAGIATDANLKVTDDKLTITQFVKIDMNPFRYTIVDKAGTVLYAGANLFFFEPEKHFISTFDNFQMNDAVGTPLFGMGGRSGNVLLGDNADRQFATWTSQSQKAFQPFYVFMQKQKGFVGVFDLATEVMEYQFDTQREEGEVLLQHISTAQALQKYFLPAASPDMVVAKFQKLVGMPMVPPEWAFGWAHYQEGVRTGADWAAIPANYKGQKLPLDSLWASTDYTDNFQTLSVDADRYDNFTANITEVRKEGVRVVPIIESGISMNAADSNTAQISGAKADVFIKSADKKAAVGSQHGNKVNYPDVTNAATATWWKTELMAFNTKYGFDGLWLDKNDLYSDCSGFCSPYDVIGTQKPTMDIENQIGYIPGGMRLDQNSLDVSAMYSTGTEFSLHNKFPLLQATATQAIWSGAKTRPFLTSSTSSAGQGAVSVSLSAYNEKTQPAMAQSVQDLYMANVYGMPFHGSDVCGFEGAKIDQTLCARWFMLAALQPFARYANSQQTVMGPWEMTDDTKTQSVKTNIELIRDAMKLKYTLLRYTISFFHGIAAEGGAYYKPLFFEFPEDLAAYTYTDQNTMLGNSVKLSFNPSSLDFQNDESHFYFPEGKWCQFFPAKKDTNPCFTAPVGGMYMTGDDGLVKLAEEQLFLHMKEGAIVPITEISDELSVDEAMKLPTTLHMGPPSTTATTGYLAFDSNGTGDDLAANVMTFKLTSQVKEVPGAGGKMEDAIYLTFDYVNGPAKPAKYVKAASADMNLGKVQVYDIASLEGKTDYNEVQCQFTDITGDTNDVTASVTFDKDTSILSFDLTGIESPALDGAGLNMQFVDFCRIVRVG